MRCDVLIERLTVDADQLVTREPLEELVHVADARVDGVGARVFAANVLTSVRVARDDG